MIGINGDILMHTKLCKKIKILNQSLIFCWVWIFIRSFPLRLCPNIKRVLLNSKLLNLNQIWIGLKPNIFPRSGGDSLIFKGTCFFFRVRESTEYDLDSSIAYVSYVLENTKNIGLYCIFRF